MSITEQPTRSQHLPLLGERLCLNFANTLDERLSNTPSEIITSYAELVAWGAHAGALTQRQARHLLQIADRRPAAADTVVGRAITLREGIYGIFVATIHAGTPDTADLAILNAVLTEAMGRAIVRPLDDAFAWEWPEDEVALDRVLWPIARSAAELLTSDELRRVRQCPGRACGYLFLDTSRNQTRRWCSMQICGNRARVRAYFERKRASDADSES